MKTRLSIAPEIFNSISVPQHDAESVRISDYVSVIMLRLPVCTDVMIERAFWNCVCDFCKRTCTLLERKSGTVSSSGKVISLTQPTYGSFKHFVGAGMNGEKVSIGDVTFNDTSTYPTVTFDTATTSTTAYADFAVTPDINAVHDTTPVTSGGATTYPNDKWILPKWFLMKYDQALISGTSFLIFSQTGRKWTDFNAASVNAFSYNREISTCSRGVITSGMRKHILNGIETPFITNVRDNTNANSNAEQKQ